jgi:hypothetical protein
MSEILKKFRTKTDRINFCREYGYKQWNGGKNQIIRWCRKVRFFIQLQLVVMERAHFIYQEMELKILW